MSENATLVGSMVSSTLVDIAWLDAPTWSGDGEDATPQALGPRPRPAS